MNSFLEFLKKHWSTVIGAAGGLILGILFLTIGFFETLLLVVLSVAGGCIGAFPAVRQVICSWFKAIFEHKNS